MPAATRRRRGSGAHPRRSASSPVATAAMPSARAAATSALTSHGPGSRNSEYGGCGRRGPSGGWATDGPSRPATSISPVLAPTSSIAVLPARPPPTRARPSLFPPRSCSRGCTRTLAEPPLHDRGLGGGGWVGAAERAQPADRERARDVAVLPGPVQLSPYVGAGHPVVQLHLDLTDPEALLQQVDRQAGLDTE